MSGILPTIYLAEEILSSSVFTGYFAAIIIVDNRSSVGRRRGRLPVCGRGPLLVLDQLICAVVLPGGGHGDLPVSVDVPLGTRYLQCGRFMTIGQGCNDKPQIQGVLVATTCNLLLMDVP